MKILTVLYLMSLLISAVILFINFRGNKRILSLLYEGIKKNRRIIIFIIFSFLLSVFKVIENKYFSNLFKDFYYYFVLYAYYLCLVFWVIRSIKKKELNLFLKAFNRELNFEELFMYIILITILFPIGSDIVRASSKFPFEISVNLNNDFVDHSSFNKYVNIIDKIKIQNNESKIYNVKVETFASQFYSEDFIDSMANISNDNFLVFENKGVINSNSQIELELLSRRIFMPNFIGRPLDIDSIGKIISGDSLLIYTKLFESVKNEKFKGTAVLPEYSNFLIKYARNGLIYKTMFNWSSKVTISNNIGNSVFVFRIKGTLNHEMGLLINIYNNKCFFAPGNFIETCEMKPKFTFNNKEKELSKDFFSCQFINNFDNNRSFFKEDKIATSIYYGSQSDNMLFEYDGYSLLIYIRSYDLKFPNYYNDLIDNL